MVIDEKKLISRLFAGTLGLGLVIGLGVTAKLYIDSQNKLSQLQAQLTKGAPNSSQAVSDGEIIAQVARHIVLPSETPKVVTLSDVAALKRDQPFFNQASDGDKLLVYSSKVILYSPVLDKIIEIAQIRGGDQKSADVAGTQSGILSPQ